MSKSVKVYGNVCIDKCIERGITKEFPINLEYYKTHNNISENQSKPYGIGIVKTYKDNIETTMEKSEFNHIFSKEKEADNMLKLLIDNKVTPISLRDILEDFILITNNE